MKICGNGAFTENFLTRKLGEISVFNVVQELNFSKLVRLQPATVPEIELHSFFHCFPYDYLNAQKVAFAYPADIYLFKVNNRNTGTS